MVTTFTIDRSTWLHGEGTERSMLLRGDGKMCCLGSLALACDIPRDSILGRTSPLNLSYAMGRRLPEPFQSYGWNSVPLRIIRVNDTEDIADGDREKQLTDSFQSIGIEVTFTGTY